MIPDASDGRAEKLIDRAGIDIVAGDAGRHFTYLKDQGTMERMCRGPEPDFSRTASGGISTAMPTIMGSVAAIGDAASKGSLDLGGRDPAVLITRELMYRACELAANTNADPATEREIYRQFLAAIIEISKNHAGTGSTPLAAEPNMPTPVSTNAAGKKWRDQRGYAATDRDNPNYYSKDNGSSYDKDSGYEPPDPDKDR
jgi:hypothetical protein